MPTLCCEVEMDGRSGAHRHRHARGAGGLRGGRPMNAHPRGSSRSSRLSRPPVHYLDNGAIGADCRAAAERCGATRRPAAPTCMRGVHRLAERATEAYQNAPRRGRGLSRRVDADGGRVHRRLHAGDQHSSPTSYGARLKPGDEILLSELEHHSNIVPWQLLRPSERRRASGMPGHGRRPHRPRARWPSC